MTPCLTCRAANSLYRCEVAGPKKQVTIHFCGTVVVELPEDELNDTRISDVWQNVVTDEQVAREARLNRWWETDPRAPQLIKSDSDRGRRRSSRYTEGRVHTKS